MSKNWSLNPVEVAVAHVSAPFEDLTGTARPLWRDYSKYQGMIDFDVAWEGGVLGVYIRAGISWGYQDKWFPRNWEEAGRAGMYRTSYHVLYPDQPVKDQFNNWKKIHPTLDIIPRVIDLEVHNDTPPNKIALATWEMSEMVADHDGVRPMIYSRYLLINQWLAPFWTIGQINEHKYILAQYLSNRTIEHPGPPTVPEGVFAENIFAQQTADKKPGYPGEVESKAVDWDRIEVGSIEQMHKYIENTWGKSKPPAQSNDCEFEYEVSHDVNDSKLDIHVNVIHKH